MQTRALEQPRSGHLDIRIHSHAGNHLLTVSQLATSTFLSYLTSHSSSPELLEEKDWQRRELRSGHAPLSHLSKLGTVLYMRHWQRDSPTLCPQTLDWNAPSSIEPESAIVAYRP